MAGRGGRDCDELAHDGRRRKCVAQNKRNRKKRSGTRYVTVGTKSFANVPAGSNTLVVTKVNGRALKPGTYRVTVQAFDANDDGLTPTVLTVKIRG